MGTSASHGGSNKDWDAVADDDLMEWFDNLPDGGDPNNGDEPGPEHEGDGSGRRDPVEENVQPAPELPAAVLARIARALRSGADGPGGGTGMGQGRGAGGGGGGGAGGGGRARSVARTGSRTAASVSAYLQGDADTLDTLGLRLDELEALDDDWDRAVAIADAATGDDPSGAEDEDARWSAVQTVTWALAQDPPPELREVVEQFLADYIYRRVSYEIGHRLRDGSGDGADSVVSERSLRAGIRISVRSEIGAEFSDTESVSELSELVARVFDYTMDVRTGR